MIHEHIRELHTELRVAEFQTDSIYWERCLAKLTEAEANECQQQAYDRSSSKRPQYAPFFNDWETPNFSIYQDEQDARKAEVNLMTFRNYCQLNIMMLLTLIQTYEYEPEDPDQESFYDQDRANLYRTETNTWIEFCHGYLSWSIDQVKKFYANFDFQKVCENTSINYMILNAYWILSKEYTCFSRLGYSFAPNTECSVDLNQKHHASSKGYTECCGGIEVGKRKLQIKYDGVHGKERDAVNNYLTSQFTTILAKWIEIQSDQGTSTPTVADAVKVPTKERKKKVSKNVSNKKLRHNSNTLKHSSNKTNGL